MLKVQNLLFSIYFQHSNLTLFGFILSFCSIIVSFVDFFMHALQIPVSLLRSLRSSRSFLQRTHSKYCLPFFTVVVKLVRNRGFPPLFCSLPGFGTSGVSELSKNVFQFSHMQSFDYGHSSCFRN